MWTKLRRPDATELMFRKGPWRHAQGAMDRISANHSTNRLLSFLFLVLLMAYSPCLPVCPSFFLPCALLTCMSPVVGVNSDKSRRDSLFCPDELDSLFSYFDNSSKLRSSKYRCSRSSSCDSPGGVAFALRSRPLLCFLLPSAKMRL